MNVGLKICIKPYLKKNISRKLFMLLLFVYLNFQVRVTEKGVMKQLILYVCPP